MTDKEFVDAAHFDLLARRRWEWRFKKLEWFDEEKAAGDIPKTDEGEAR